MTDRSADDKATTMEDSRVEQARAAIRDIFRDRSIERVLLIAPPDGDASMFKREVAQRKRYHNHPQYGLGVIASVLRADGLDVSILNLNHEVLTAARSDAADFDFNAVVRREVSERVTTFEPDLIGVTCMYSQAHRALVETLDVIHAVAPRTPIALGGVHPTNTFVDRTTRDRFLEDIRQVSVLLLYEAEYSFRCLLGVINGRADAADLTQVVFTATRPVVAIDDRVRPDGPSLDIIPALDLMQLPEMSRVGRIGAFYSVMPDDTVYATSLFGRGCRFQCTFCSVRHFNGAGVRSRSVETVLDELEIMTQEFGISHVSWLDDDFFYNKHRTMALMDGIARRNLSMTWDCSNGVVAAACTEDLIAAAEETGCVGMYLGIESGSPEILKSIQKPGTVKYFRRAAEILGRHPGIHARAFLIIGLPGETFSNIIETFDLCREMNLDWCHVNIYNALPNTVAYAVSDNHVDIDLTEFRFNSTAYGIHNKPDECLPNSFAANCEHVFDRPDLDSIPTRPDLDLIWVYMNYYINFLRLRKPMSEQKLRQQDYFLRNIVNTIDPGNAIAYWYAADVGRRLQGEADPDLVARMSALLDAHPVWATRFAALGLDPAALGPCGRHAAE